jgi:hypothetical protein
MTITSWKQSVHEMRAAPWGLALTLALAALAVYRVIPSIFLPFVAHFHPNIDSDFTMSRLYEIRDGLITVAVWLIAFVLFRSSILIRGSLRRHWRPAYTTLCLVAACSFIVAFILHFGNRQFGAWDFGIMIDTGWRQIIGQRPYVDFLTTAPPGFNLGIKYAFQIFGLRWDSQLYATAILAVGSFLWLYWLLYKLTHSRMIGFWLAFAAEAAITLELSFWWFNSVTETFVLLFFLSCLLVSRQSRFVGAQLSYYFSLWPLALMKPNMAFTMGVCGIGLALCATDRKLRVALLTLAAAATTPLVLYLNGVSIPAMLANYHAATIERTFTFFGLRAYNPIQLAVIYFWTFLLALPISTVLPSCWSAFRQRQWRQFAFQLFFPAIFLISCYGMMTNSDFVDMQLINLLVGGTIILFVPGMPTPKPPTRRIFIALIFAMLASDLYAGAMRWRVHGIGPFFEWSDADHRVNSSFFGDLRASPRMSAVVQQISQAVSDNQGPYFMGPRIEIGYALNRLPSPDHMALLWDPGAFFARKDQGKLIYIWQEHNYKTLIFLKGEYIFYPPEFISLIQSEYIRDDRYSELTVYHALPR